MRDGSESQRDYEEVEENHDGWTMILLVAGAVLACGLFLSAGYAAFTLVFDDGPDPDVVASNEPVDLAEKDEPSSEPVSQPNSAASVDDPEKLSASKPPVQNPTVVATAPATSAEPATAPVAQAKVPAASTEIGSASEPISVEDAPKGDHPKSVAAANPTTPEIESPVETAASEESTTQERPKATAAVTPTQVAAVTPASVVTTKSTNEETGQSLKPPARGTPLSYQWNPGDIQGYSVDMTTTVNGQKQSVSGTVELTCDEQPPKVDSKVASKKTKPETGTGSGFFVSADGHLVTCAHVIQGANRVDVEINGQSYSATVVAVEADDDLAILKIDAQGLTPLPLADSSQVRLGEEVRAIGFPLSTVLGNGIKVTRGIVAGIVDRDEGKRFQIDAAVNPGNSGGPVVNDRGQVLGVASSKLIGMELTQVGFCVPAQRVLSLLKEHKVEPVKAQPTKALDGPSLVEAVAPSVALITVSIDPQTVSGELVRIRTSGKFTTKRETNNRQRLMFSFPNMTFNSGSLNVDAYGNVESFEAPNQLPFLAGPMALLTVHQFDPAGRSSWTVRDRIKVSVQRDNSPFGRMRIPAPRLPNFGRRIRDPFAPETIKEFEAQQVHQYRIVSDSDDKVVLEKTFTLTTLDNDDAPYFRITGQGEVVFSRSLGLVESFEFDHHYEKNEDKETVRIPVKISVRRQDSAVFAKRKRDGAIAQAKVEHDNAIKAADKAAIPPGEQLVRQVTIEWPRGVCM
jgi:serine protease Do